jgi:hypothetical protein
MTREGITQTTPEVSVNRLKGMTTRHHHRVRIIYRSWLIIYSLFRSLSLNLCRRNQLLQSITLWRLLQRIVDPAWITEKIV